MLERDEVTNFDSLRNAKAESTGLIHELYDGGRLLAWKLQPDSADLRTILHDLQLFDGESDNNGQSHENLPASADLPVTIVAHAKPEKVEIDSTTGVETITFPDGSFGKQCTIGGRRHCIKYDNTGKPNSYSNDSNQWTSPDGRAWTLSGSGEEWQGTISVGQDGSLIFKTIGANDIVSQYVILHRDGSSTRQDKCGDSLIVTETDQNGQPTKRLDQQGHWNRKDNQWFHQESGKVIEQHWNDRIGATFFGTGSWNGDYQGLARELKAAREQMQDDEFRKFLAKIEQGTSNFFQHSEENGTIEITIGGRKVHPTMGTEQWAQYRRQYPDVSLLPPPGDNTVGNGIIDNTRSDKPVVVVSSVPGTYGKETRVFVVQPGEKTPDDRDIDGIVTDARIQPLLGPDGKWYPPLELPADTKLIKITDGVTAVMDEHGRLKETERSGVRIGFDAATGAIAGPVGAGLGAAGYNPWALFTERARQTVPNTAFDMSSHEGVYYTIKPWPAK